MPTSPNNIQQYPKFLTKVKLCPKSSNNTQHHPTMPSMGGKTIPTFIPNIVGICWAKMLASFGQGFTCSLRALINSSTNSKRWFIPGMFSSPSKLCHWRHGKGLGLTGMSKEQKNKLKECWTCPTFCTVGVNWILACLSSSTMCLHLQ